MYNYNNKSEPKNQNATRRTATGYDPNDGLHGLPLREVICIAENGSVSWTEESYSCQSKQLLPRLLWQCAVRPGLWVHHRVSFKSAPSRALQIFVACVGSNDQILDPFCEQSSSTLWWYPRNVSTEDVLWLKLF